MSQKTKTILLVVLIIALIVVAGIAYTSLQSKLPTAESAVSSSASTGPAASSAAAQSTASTANSEVPAPDFTVLDNDGNEVKLSEMQGKPVVINFWATWCVYCKQEMPDFNTVYADYADDVQFMMVNLTNDSETMENAKKFIEDSGYTFPVYFDVNQEALTAYSTYSIPQTFFITAEGNVKYYQPGAMQESALRQAIDGLL